MNMESKFLTNYTKTTFLDEVKKGLQDCKSFSLSVSFIKKAGLVLIQNELEEALKRGAIGKIITSTYQNFTDIESLNTFLDWMSKYDNFKCHLDYNCFGDNGFHTKGYIFEKEDCIETIIGSSNITRFALLKNKEWNVSILSKEENDTLLDIHKEFDELWQQTLSLDQELIDKYAILLEYAIEKWDMDYFNPDTETIKPNAMQRKALKELRRNRDLGIDRSLIVSATGSGKTYLAAFDAKNFGANRLLYIVHRDAILVEALKSFKKVFGNEHTYGIYNSKNQDLDCDFIFASTSMLLKHLDSFATNEFDYIVYDEAHHMASDGGTKIFEYFKPDFLLGLTATPERMDQRDVFNYFEYNVPFELRLRDAIINDLVVPFHYYGIRDSYIDYGIEDKRKVSNEILKEINIDFIIEQIEKHKKQNEKLKALAFCTDIRHCKDMADAFIEKGYCAVSLTGGNDTGERIKAFKDLQNEKSSLQIITAVDILNEGVDIPAVNMVLFLRPTESQTIFLQQLGRGLRKYDNKEYLTVLDFIGNNYGRSVQIALALGTLGKTTYTEKQYLSDLISTDFQSLNIPNVQIFFDDLSKVEIINYLKKENFNLVNYLKKDYENFKKYLNKKEYPAHMDYLDCDIAPDLMRFMKANTAGHKNKSYYSFLQKIGEETIPSFNKEEIELIDAISELLPIVRVDEYLIIKQLLDNPMNLLEFVSYNNKVTIETLKHAKFVLEKKKIVKNDKLNISRITKSLKEWIIDLCDYGLNRHEVEFGEYDGLFKLHGNYYKEQTMMIMQEDGLMFMKGTKFNDDGSTIVYVGIKKDKTKEERMNYKDKFLSSNVFQWESENNTTETNETGKKILNTRLVHLFVRKMDDEDGITLPFTYFGTGKFTNMRKSFVEVYDNKTNTIKNVDTLLFDIVLDDSVAKDYFQDFNI